MEKLGAYFAEHPESVPAVQAVLMKEPIASFATAEYFSPHAFGLVDADGNRRGSATTCDRGRRAAARR